MVRFVKIFGSLYKTECCIYGKRYILFNRFAPAEALKFRYLWYSGKKDSDFEYDIYHGFKTWNGKRVSDVMVMTPNGTLTTVNSK